jgi:general secretion pathway protein G
MRRRAKRKGFSLIEVLMVVVTLAIIAGVVLPQVGSALDDAKHSAMLSHLHELSNAIQRYRVDHDGFPPDLLSARGLPQLTSKTNRDGDTGTGPEFVYGPYMIGGIPENPLNRSRLVFQVNTAPPANLQSRVGWAYHPDSGQIWAGLYRGSVDESAAMTPPTNP